MTARQVTENDLNVWLKAANEHVWNDYKKFMKPGEYLDRQLKEYPTPLSAEVGKVYVRIVRDFGQRSAWGFIDMTNGNVLKAAGWKAPAKNFARGNIFDDKHGLGRAAWTSVL